MIKNKNIIILLFILQIIPSIAFSQKDEQPTKKEIKVYFAARLSQPEYRENNLLMYQKMFNNNYNVFLPQDIIIPKLEYSMVQTFSYLIDKAAIDLSDIVFLLSPYGKDCSWEIGYARGKNKFIVAFLVDTESVKDTMVMGALNLIITDNPEIMNFLTNDYRTKNKCILIKEGDDFDVIKHIYEQSLELKNNYEIYPHK